MSFRHNSDSTECNKYFGRAAILLALCAIFFGSEVAFAGDVYMFSYFKNANDGSDGLHLAYSLDGLSYHAVNGDAAVTGPMAGASTRDPYTFLGADGIYRCLHTTEPWSVNSKICYGESTDLITWTNKKYIDIMGSVPGTQQAWAPQCYWDAANSQYLVYWSSQVGTGTGTHFKIYYSTTKDFDTFSSPAVLYDHGDTKIDADIVKDGSNYVMFLAGTSKAQGGTNLYGPYSTNLQQLTSGYASEGPSAVKIGDTWIVYNDHYGSQVMGAVASTDGMATWTEYTASVAFPGNFTSKDARHGNVFTVPLSVAQNLASNAPNKPAEDEFIGSAGTADFNTASNWFAGSVPGVNQVPIIQGGFTVNMMSSPSGTFSGINVGETSTGVLNISNNAAVTINAAWPNGLVVGDRVPGNGTIVQSGTSSVTVTGFASIGRYGTGTYRLQGGKLSVSGDFNIGDIRGSHGYLIVENGTVTIPSLFVGSGYSDGFTTGNAQGSVTQSGGTVTITGGGDSVVIGGRDNNAYGVGSYAISDGTFDAGNNSNIFIGKYGQGTFTQTGGTAYGRVWISIGRYAGAVGNCSISDGALFQTNSTTRIIVGEQGTGALTVSGGGLLDTAGGLRVSMNYGGAVGSGEVHLDGGTIYTPFVEDGGGTSAFHFNGGTLKARNATATFMQNLDLTDVQAGGATIDTNGFNVTIAQPLLAGSTTGGLKKQGLGTLTLTSAPSYTGDTRIEAGVLQLNCSAATLGNITGAGDLIVAGSTQLTAASISVGTLTIGGQPVAVPEPGMAALLTMGLLIVAAYGCLGKK
jgi:autotransporter-associated beta strand protein/T5SS/PEP-CTERM-associated repeat protein